MSILNDLKPVGNVSKQPSSNVLSDLKPVSVGAGSSSSDTGSTNFAKIRDAIAKQESEGSGGYLAVNPSGALGKYQILPKYHFDKIGLKDTAADRKKYLNTPALQDTLFEKVIEENKNRYGTDEKAIAAYYGGGLGANNYGTPDGDLQGKYAWNKDKQKWDTSKPTGYPSVNEYVNSVLRGIRAGDASKKLSGMKKLEYSAGDFFKQEVDKTVKGIPGAVGGFIRDVFQGIARFPVSIMNEVLGDYKYADKNTTLGKAQRIVFGDKTGDKIGGVFTESVSERELAKSVGLPEEVGTGAFLGLGLLDYVTGGGASKVIKGIVKVSKIEDAVKLAKQIGVADNLVDDFAKKAVKVKNEKGATELLNAYDTVQKDLVKKAAKVSGTTTKVEDASKPLLTEAPVEQIKPKVELTKTPAEIKAEYASKVPEELLPVYNNARKAPDLNTFVSDNMQTVKVLGLNDKEAKSSLEYLYKTAKEEKIDLGIYGVTPKITKIQSRIGQSVRPASKNILVKESVALKTRLKAMSTGAKFGAKEAKDTIETFQEDAVKFIEKHLPKDFAKNYLKRAVRAKTPATFNKLISDVTADANKYKKALAYSKEVKTLSQKFGYINKLSEINRQAISDIKRQIGLVDSKGRVKNIKQATPEQLEEAIRLAKERFTLKRDEGLIKGQVNVTGKKDVISNEGFAKAAVEIKKSKSGLTGLGERVKDFKHKVGLGIDKVIRPISTRIKKISKGVATRLSKAGFKEGIEIAKGAKKIEPFQEKFKNLDTNKQGVFWGNVLNGNFNEAGKIAKAGGFEKEFNDVKGWLNEMLKKAQDAGIDVRGMENYFPRLITDSAGLADYIRTTYRGKTDGGVVSKIVDSFITKKGVKPTEAEIEEALNKAVRGFGGGNNKAFISGTPFEKERLIKEIPPEMLRFYADPITSLLRYNEVMNRNIEMRKFFGKNVKVLPNGEYDLLDTVGSYILKEKPNITADEAKELSDMLVARFAILPANTIVKNAKELIYITQMNQFLSAVTQLGDILPSMYINGVMPTLKAMFKKKGIKMGDAGLDRVSAEIENAGDLAKAVEKIFKWSQITRVDRFGKETFLNSAFDNLKRDAKIFGKTGKDNKSIQYLRDVLGDEADAAIKLLRDNPEKAMQDENVLFALYNKLSRVQPISLSEVPEMYLKHPNGRIFYALKTWTLKMFDTVRTEGIEQAMSKNPKVRDEGIKNLASLVTLLTLSGVATGSIKDFINGKEFNPTDNAVGSLLQIAGLNRYLFNEANVARGDISGWTGIVIPGQYIASDAIKDVAGLVTGKSEFKYEDLNMMKYLPLLGRPAYNRFGKGAKSNTKKKGKSRSLTRIR